MKFLVISDLHGAIKNLDKLDREFKAADIVLFAGDFAGFNHPESGEPALDALCKKHETVFSVLGNCDEPDFIANIEKKDISVEHAILYRDGLAFAGCGGGTIFNGSTPNERKEEDMMKDFDAVLSSLQASADDEGHWKDLIVISHNPPKDTLCDQVSPGVHVGSQMLRSFIEKVQPLAVITGHIHEGVGIDHIGATVVINPGPLADGFYAVMEIKKTNDAHHVTQAELRNI